MPDKHNTTELLREVRETIQNQRDSFSRMESSNSRDRRDVERRLESMESLFERSRKDTKAVLDNLDRSVLEMTSRLDSHLEASSERHAFVKDLLESEREERKELRKEAKDDLDKDREKEQQERTRREDILVSAAKAVWDKGGQWIVAAVAFWITIKLSGGGEELLALLKLGK